MISATQLQRHLIDTSTRQHPLIDATKDFLQNNISNLEEIIDSPSTWKMALSESDSIENWKTCLGLSIICSSTKNSLKFLAKKIHGLYTQPWNHHSQFARALVALNQHLANIPVLDVKPNLLEGGAAPIEIQEYCPWQSLPYNPSHAEFGTILSLLAFFTDNVNLKKDVEKVAEWQLNTLSARFLPVPALYVQEQNGAYIKLLAWNYLFFKSMSTLMGQTQYNHVVDVQLAALFEHLEKNQLEMDPLFILLEIWIDRHVKEFSEQNVLKELPNKVVDSSMALAGIREKDFHAFLTMHGGHTGFGNIKFYDTEVINFGPQNLPLEDCRGFGLEGNFITDHGLRKSEINFGKNNFKIKGCVRLVDQPKANQIYTSLGVFKGIWLEVEGIVNPEQATIQAQMLGLQGWGGVAFSFYVKSKSCLISNEIRINSNSLKHYEGNASDLTIEGEKYKIIFRNDQHLRVNVIPLGASDNYWGADFLIAYILDPKQANYSWTISFEQ